jgi:hypothetical protein
METLFLVLFQDISLYTYSLFHNVEFNIDYTQFQKCERKWLWHYLMYFPCGAEDSH